MPLRIKIFSDGADKASMLERAADPSIHGLTTNPSLMKAAGITDYRAFCKEILEKIKDKPISFEVFADDFEEMRRQAEEIASWGDNVYVKIPITNSEGRSSIPLIETLAGRGISLNVTALLTLSQVSDTVAALKGGPPSIISVFAGRIADTGRDPMPLMQAAVEIAHSVSKDAEVLWASTREVLNVVQADQTGCDIITVPPAILAKMKLFGKDLQELSLDTVRQFKRDADEAGFSL